MPSGPPDPALAAAVLAARRARGLSLDALAVEARTTRSTLRLLERFGIAPQEPIFGRICAVLQLQAESLVGPEETPLED